MDKLKIKIEFYWGELIFNRFKNQPITFGLSIQEKGKILKDSKTEKRAIELLNQGNDKVTVANKLEAEGLIKIKKFLENE